jgi:hypothetical protein
MKKRIHNDLVDGNTFRAYNDISKDLDEVLVDFKYLTSKKNFLRI